MANFFDIFNKSKPKEKEEPINVGQVSQIPSGDLEISVDRWKTTDILREIEQTTDTVEAIDTIVNKTPDGKMALNIYLRLIDQGFDIELRDRNTGKVVDTYDMELREFCSKIGGTTSNGLDGLSDQLYTSEILHGGMAVEVVVAKGAKEIEQVLVIDPKTFEKFEWLPDKKRYAIYQKTTDGSKRDLFDGNFFWIPHQPKIGRPDGTLQFEPAVMTMTQVYQLIRDSLAVLNRIGFPKYDISIDIEKMLSSASTEVLADEKKRRELIESTFRKVRNSMSSIGRDSNIIHYDSVSVDTVGGGVNGSGIDIRAWFEVFDPLIVNSFQLTPVLMGRLKSGSYSLGTAEYKIVKENMEVFRRSHKRMLENIINLWARVKGYNVVAVVNHYPIDWEKTKEKVEAEILQMQKARRAEEYGYVSHETASQMALGKEAEPQNEPQLTLYEYLSKDFGKSPKENKQKVKEKEDEQNE